MLAAGLPRERYAFTDVHSTLRNSDRPDSDFNRKFRTIRYIARQNRCCGATLQSGGTGHGDCHKLGEGTLTITHRYLGLAACFVLASSGVVAAHAEPASATKTFLTDYSKLIPDIDGKDLLYIAPNVERRAKAYTHVMVDEPEVFISPESPYQGAKPQDIAAISGLVRDATGIIEA